MLKKLALCLSLMVCAPAAFADVLALTPGSKVIEGITVANSAVANLSDGKVDLQLAGAGLRSKRVAIVNVKVYVATLLVSDLTKYQRSADNDAALNSAASMKAVAFRLDFIRGVSADQIMGAYRDSLQANQVDMNQEQIKDFLDVVTQAGDAQDGKSLTLVLDRISDHETDLTYENTNGKDELVKGDGNFMKQILSIWLGSTTDAGLASLKNALISGN